MRLEVQVRPQRRVEKVRHAVRAVGPAHEVFAAPLHGVRRDPVLVHRVVGEHAGLDRGRRLLDERHLARVGDRRRVTRHRHGIVADGFLDTCRSRRPGGCGRRTAPGRQSRCSRGAVPRAARRTAHTPRRGRRRRARARPDGRRYTAKPTPWTPLNAWSSSRRCVNRCHSPRETSFDASNKPAAARSNWPCAAMRSASLVERRAVSAANRSRMARSLRWESSREMKARAARATRSTITVGACLRAHRRARSSGPACTGRLTSTLSAVSVPRVIHQPRLPSPWPVGPHERLTDRPACRPYSASRTVIGTDQGRLDLRRDQSWPARPSTNCRSAMVRVRKYASQDAR